MNETIDNKNYKHENQFYQEQTAERYKMNYNNSNNYNNSKEEYAIYDFDRQFYDLYINHFYPSQNNYFNRNQS